MSGVEGVTFVSVCAVADVPPESAIAVEVDGTELAIVHSAGRFYAIADECSHAAIPLSEGDVGDGEIECYMHGSRFDLSTGRPDRAARHRTRSRSIAAGLTATMCSSTFPSPLDPDQLDPVRIQTRSTQES